MTIRDLGNNQDTIGYVSQGYDQKINLRECTAFIFKSDKGVEYFVQLVGNKLITSKMSNVTRGIKTPKWIMQMLYGVDVNE